MYELKKILRDITVSTTVRVTVYTDGDVRVEGDDIKHSLPQNGEKIYSDEKNGVTVFKFVFFSEEYYGVINACGMEGHNYAVMISRMIEGSLSRQARITKREALRKIVVGDASPDETRAFKEKYSFPDGACFVIAVSAERNMPEIENLINQASTDRTDCLVHVSDNSCALIKFTSDDVDYQSASEFCEFIVQSAFEEIGIRPIIGVGGVVQNFLDIAVSGEQAFTAVRMCKKFSSKGEIHTYKEYLLTKMLEGIPENRKREYISEFLDDRATELFDDDEMTGTAEEFLSNSLNVSETSRNLFMHRNTLMYRLDKIEKITGLNIRKFPDAVSFRVLTILYTLLK